MYGKVLLAAAGLGCSIEAMQVCGLTWGGGREGDGEGVRILKMQAEMFGGEGSLLQHRRCVRTVGAWRLATCRAVPQWTKRPMHGTCTICTG